MAPVFFKNIFETSQLNFHMYIFKIKYFINLEHKIIYTCYAHVRCSDVIWTIYTFMLQNRQCTYNEIPRRVHETIVVVEKQ